MSDKEKKSVKKRYNEVAKKWDRRYEGLGGEHLKLEEEYIFQDTDFKNKRILDIGTGTGRFVFPLSKKAKEIIGIDISEEMIDYSRSKLESHKADNVSFHVMDASEIDFEKNKFDIVLGVGIFEYIEELSPYFEEVNRVLKERGRFILTIHNKKWIFNRESKTGHGFSKSEHSLKELKSTLEEDGFKVKNFYGIFYLPMRHAFRKVAEKTGPLGKLLMWLVVKTNKVLNRSKVFKERASELMIHAKKW